jgi:hypothetical protein
MYVAREPVELGDHDRRLELASPLQRGRELRALVERIGALASLALDELGDDVEALRLGEALDGRALAFETKAAAALTTR